MNKRIFLQSMILAMAMLFPVLCLAEGGTRFEAGIGAGEDLQGVNGDRQLLSCPGNQHADIGQRNSAVKDRGRPGVHR